MENSDEKFVLLVEEREVLYDTKQKEHRNRNVIDSLWKEIAEEMNMTINASRQKWTNLRNSYARHLRNQNRSSGSGAKNKSEWYLANAMSFLKDHMQQRKQKGNAERGDENRQAFSEESHIVNENEENFSERAKKRPAAELHRNHKRPNKMFPSEHAVNPVTVCLESNTKNSAQDHPLLDFMKGLLLDFQQLSPRRQRAFKLKTINLLNELLDEEESDITNFPMRTSTPTS